MDYQDFLSGKMRTASSAGIEPTEAHMEWLKPFQRDLTRWSLRKGRSAIFAGTGLGKTRMSLTWASQVSVATGRRVMILAPLAVASQTVVEGQRISIKVKLCREQVDVEDGINITNYDRLHKFDASGFGAVVMDESGCIKHHDTKTLATMLSSFRDTPFKLCCTATPAPNDWTELGTHAEFLGACSRVEMLSEFFCHDGGETQVWRLKGHARAAFWKWVSSWGAMVSHPRDLGYDEPGYDLPPLRVHEHLLPVDSAVIEGAGLLFAEEAGSLMERRQARKLSLKARVEACAAVVLAEPEAPWVIWCDLNAESDALARAIPMSREIRGSMTTDDKEAALEDFASGKATRIISKASITGFGLNWQHCAHMAFVGVTDSWEAYYQAVRRCYRFGQTRPVHVHIFASEAEGAVVANLKRKESDALAMSQALAAETAASVRAEVRGLERTTNEYNANTKMKIPSWLCEVMQ